MPSVETILSNAEVIASRWRVLAIGWHVIVAMLILRIISGWRPSTRFAGYLLTAPLLSVGVLAGTTGNPFNGFAFGALALLLVGVASRFDSQPVNFGTKVQIAIGILLITLGWTYPHFLRGSHWTEYLYAAPLGLLPCPTLSAVIGFTLVLGMLRSTAWRLALASAGAIYGLIGVFVLGVLLDYGLLAGALVLGGVAGAPTRRDGANRDDSTIEASERRLKKEVPV